MVVSLHSTSSSSCIRSSDRVVCAVAVAASPCPPFLGRADTICSVLCYGGADTDEGEGVRPLGSLQSTAEDHRPQSEWMLRVPMLLDPSSLFPIYYQVTSMETLCPTAAAVRQSRPGRERRGYGDVVYQGVLSILLFPFLLPHSSMINTTVQELQKVMKTVGLGCIGEPKMFSLQAHPKQRDHEGHDLHMLFCSSPAFPSSALHHLVKVKVTLHCATQSLELQKPRCLRELPWSLLGYSLSASLPG